MVCGSMFSGKTEELIRRLNRARIGRTPSGLEYFRKFVVQQYLNLGAAGCAGTKVARTPYMESGSIQELKPNRSFE